MNCCFFNPVENIYQRQMNKNYLNKQKSHFTGFTAFIQLVK